MGTRRQIRRSVPVLVPHLRHQRNAAARLGINNCTEVAILQGRSSILPKALKAVTPNACARLVAPRKWCAAFALSWCTSVRLNGGGIVTKHLDLLHRLPHRCGPLVSGSCP